MRDTCNVVRIFSFWCARIYTALTFALVSLMPMHIGRKRAACKAAGKVMPDRAMVVIGWCPKTTKAAIRAGGLAADRVTVYVPFDEDAYDKLERGVDIAFAFVDAARIRLPGNPLRALPTPRQRRRARKASSRRNEATDDAPTAAADDEWEDVAHGEERCTCMTPTPSVNSYLSLNIV